MDNERYSDDKLRLARVGKFEKFRRAHLPQLIEKLPLLNNTDAQMTGIDFLFLPRFFWILRLGTSTVAIVSPTVFRHKNYRFFFFSREEKRRHVHVSCVNGEAKFWLEPIVALANNYGLTPRQLKNVQKIIEWKRNEITSAWQKHFKH